MKVQSRIDELLTLRASEWFEIMKAPAPADRTAFIAWLGESRRHVQEFLEVAAVDEAVGGVPPALRENLDTLVARVTTPPTSLPARARAQPWRQRPGAHRSLRTRTTWIAAATVLLTLGAWMVMQARFETFSTGVGEQRTIALADSSVVMLNTDSQLRWRIDAERRDVELRRGEAIFKVMPDAQRPFRVRTPAGVVRVIGTQFNVYARHDGITRVSVLEGRVRLTAPGNGTVPDSGTLTLKAGEEADIRADGSITLDPHPAVEQAMAWRERRLIFNDAPLEEMALEFNRYNRAPRLRLINVPPQTYRFAGIFDADDPESLAALLSRESDLLVERLGREIVVRAP